MRGSQICVKKGIYFLAVMRVSRTIFDPTRPDVIPLSGQINPLLPAWLVEFIDALT